MSLNDLETSTSSFFAQMANEDLSSLLGGAFVYFVIYLGFKICSGGDK